jgi:cyclophilin family peptidyl-prolyl cis-trans isomerase
MRAPRPLTRLVVLASLAWTMAGCATTPEASVSLEDCPTAAPTAAEAPAILVDAQSVAVETNLGTFRIELYSDAAPVATANLVALVRCRFYDGISFHRVIADFVIQAGDPQTRSNRGDFDGIGSGGPGYSFAIEPPASDRTYEQYAVAMANAGRPDTNGSQFFVDLANLDARLDRLYTIVGKVVEGTEVVDAIGLVATTGADHYVPLEPVIIETMTVVSGS